MSKLKGYKDNTNSSVLGVGSTPPEESARITFGTDPAIQPNLDDVRSAKKERIEKVNIFEIIPDGRQPRRALPSDVRNQWDGKPESLVTLFGKWWSLSGDPPLEAIVFHDDEIEIDDETNVVRAGLLSLAGLASTIRRDGLLNPISVYKVDTNGYGIETGERRWLAYHLLYALSQDDKWLRISARIVSELDPFRQAAENNQRENLTAIGRARQYAILLMALNSDVDILPYAHFDSDRAYYAQALDLSTYGKNKSIMDAMGLNSRQMLANYKSLLQLPDNVWTKADDLNTSLRELLQLSNTLDNSDKLTINVDRLPAPLRRISAVIESTTKISHKQFQKMSDKHRHEFLGNIQALKAWLDEIEDWQD